MTFPKALDVFGVLHTAAVVALAMAAVALLRAYCEGFGCIGLGIAWAAWAAGFAVAALVGGLVCWRSPAGTRARRVVRVSLVLQLAMGLPLVALWLWRQLG